MSKTLGILCVTLFSSYATASIKPLGISACPLILVNAAGSEVGFAQVSELIKGGAIVTIQAKRTIYPGQVRKAIETRLKRAFEVSSAKLNREMEKAYEESHNASINGSRAGEKLDHFLALQSKLTRMKAQFEEGLEAQVEREMLSGSFEVEEARMESHIAALEIVGTLTNESSSFLRFHDHETGEDLEEPVPFVDSIMVRLTNGMTAYLKAKDVLSLTPN